MARRRGRSKFKNRTKMSKRKSKRLFSKTASGTHVKNVLNNPNPMRGGYRL